jgi:hypothetical protein
MIAAGGSVGSCGRKEAVEEEEDEKEKARFGDDGDGSGHPPRLHAWFRMAALRSERLAVLRVGERPRRRMPWREGGPAVVGDVAGDPPLPAVVVGVTACRGRSGAVDSAEDVCTRRRFGGGMAGPLLLLLCGREKRENGGCGCRCWSWRW